MKGAVQVLPKAAKVVDARSPSVAFTLPAGGSSPSEGRGNAYEQSLGNEKRNIRRPPRPLPRPTLPAGG